MAAGWAAGGGAGSLIAVELPKCVEQIVAVLAVLLADCAYLPLDLNQPPARRRRILADAGVRLVVGAGSGTTDDPGGRFAVGPAGVDARSDHPAQLAYVIYTSGSTGAPKGVMISHRAAVNTVADITSRFGIGAGDRVLGLAQLSFDLSVFDIFGVLGSGGCLVLPEPHRSADPSHWAELVAEHRVTLWNSVPAQLQMLDNHLDYDVAADISSLRTALLSGDWIPLGLPDSIRAKHPGLRVVSLGGATEAAIWSIYHRIAEVHPGWRSIPYGRPLANQTFQVLDHRMSPCPDHVTGELYIGGAGLALGYLGDPARTAARFVADPVTGQRLYHTGDLGRYGPDGVIEFLGRTDSQVKLRGHRIELGEVEAALDSFPGVAAGAVIVEGAASMERRLAAFVVGGPRRELEPAPDLAALAQPSAARAAGPVDDGRMSRFRAVLARACHASMLATLAGLGAFPPARSVSEDEILDRCGVAPRHHRLARRWLRALREVGALHPDAATGPVRPARPVTEQEVGDLWRQVRDSTVEQVWPVDVVRFFADCAAALRPLLRGELDPKELLFAHDDVTLAESAFAGNAVTRYLNASVATFGGYLAAAGRAPRVLEVGAGVGATSAALLDAVGQRPVDYFFSDVSAYFLNHGQRRFGDHPGVRYGRYDMNEPYRRQGFEPNCFDLIVCANVLHNAADLTATLSDLAELLAPGGWLLFTEITGDVPELMISMEFLLGGTEFTDHRRGGLQVFPDVPTWSRLVAEAGGRDSVVLPAEDVALGPALSRAHHHLFAARFKPDRVRLEPDELAEHLAHVLPGHMLPSHLQLVDRLPLTANGKLDRARLASWLPGERAPEDADAQPPRGPTEQVIASVWARVLRVPSVGRHTDFFGVGGDSLLVVQAVNQVRAQLQAQDVPFEQLLRGMLAEPTVARFGRFVETARRPR